MDAATSRPGVSLLRPAGVTVLSVSVTVVIWWAWGSIIAFAGMAALVLAVRLAPPTWGVRRALVVLVPLAALFLLVLLGSDVATGPFTPEQGHG